MSDVAAPELPESVAAATRDQPAARVALAGAIRLPSHAYLFAGPPGAGKAVAARAFAAELLAEGAPDADSARRRALADPSPHPDLAWLRPPGNQHLVSEVRERVIEAAPYRPYEGDRRVFVVEAAEAMAEESQNALLKTLEEPAPHAHMILVCGQPAALLETVRSRCIPVRFVALAPEVVALKLEAATPGVAEDERRAASRLATGDLGLAGLLVSERGRALRIQAERVARACRAAELDDAPWRGLLDAAEERGAELGELARGELEALADQARDSADKAGERRLRKEAGEAQKRVARRGRTEALDLGLSLFAAWMRDVAAVGDGAAELAFNVDRSDALRSDAEGIDPRAARAAAELVMDTRRRLTVNVSEELALEALCFRVERALQGR